VLSRFFANHRVATRVEVLLFTSAHKFKKVLDENLGSMVHNVP
jgi:hypothetical protein